MTLNAPTETAPVLQCDNIMFSSRGATEVDSGRVQLFVPIAEIERITLKHGRSAHSPMLTFVIALGLLLVGGYGLWGFIVSPKGYRFEIGMMVLGVIGGSMMFDTMKRRYFLEIRSKGNVTRLVFSKQSKVEAIKQFCDQIHAVYKWEIADDSKSDGSRSSG